MGYKFLNGGIQFNFMNLKSHLMLLCYACFQVFMEVYVFGGFLIVFGFLYVMLEHSGCDVSFKVFCAIVLMYVSIMIIVSTKMLKILFWQNLLNVSNEYGTKLIKHVPLELGWDEPSLIFA